MQISNKSKASRTIQSRILNVKSSLDKLSTLIINDQLLHQNTINALLECHCSSSQNDSNQSLSYEQYSQINKGYHEKQINQSSKVNPNHLTTLHNSVLNQFNFSQQSNFSTQMQTKCQNIETKQIDLTIKKGKPIKSIQKKEQYQITTNKPQSKLKNVKSEKKFLKKKYQQPEFGTKNINHKKIIPKTPKDKEKQKEKEKQREREKSKIKPHHNILSNIKGNKSGIQLKQDPLTSVSQSRGLQSKYHLNLKKQVCMKINDLKVKKLLCQKQSEYLSAALKITKQQVRKLGIFTKKFNEQSYIKIFALKSIIRFFSQFSEDSDNQEQFEDKLIGTIQNPNKLIKFTMKLPDILHRKSILSEQKCKHLTEQYIFLEEKIRKNNLKQTNIDIFFTFIVQLHNYISFLLQNDMVHQTKRKNIFTVDMKEFFSDRSTKEKTNKNGSLAAHRERTKQYDTQRKLQTHTLKRTNTTKMFSPKLKKIKKEK